ncbi:uncharacterized protein K02A2.6-like [Octopus sinensis]|uniref:Uncharacterized protein K02A2.6-like n=1 Tax=Octopus sinensis TaxID=2607531 RepID=A0A6P7T0H6_9MOLL|nr:uncharacterized protein K02A2.6-like [Octopus sinensis]
MVPSTFQQVIDSMLVGSNFAVAYFDNILIKSKSQKQHVEHVKRVFEKVREYGFKLSEEKCQFFLKKIKYLGQIINKNEWEPDPSRATVVKKNMPTQFVSFGFQKFCKMFTVEHVTMVPYYSRSNEQAECFGDTFKRALRKSNKEVMDEVVLQQIIYSHEVSIIPNLTKTHLSYKGTKHESVSAVPKKGCSKMMEMWFDYLQNWRTAHKEAKQNTNNVHMVLIDAYHLSKRDHLQYIPQF